MGMFLTLLRGDVDLLRPLTGLQHLLMGRSERDISLLESFRVIRELVDLCVSQASLSSNLKTCFHLHHHHDQRTHKPPHHHHLLPEISMNL